MSYFRHPTEEENKYIRDYLDSISIPTGFNIFEFLDDIKNVSPYYEYPNEPKDPIDNMERVLKSNGRTQTNDTPFDNVNRPAHYNTGKYESIDVMVETQGIDAVKNFCICNAFKYIYRHRFKNGIEDIKKAIWYLNKYVELEESNESK